MNIQIKETTFSYWFFGECRHDDTVDGGENRRHKKVYSEDITLLYHYTLIISGDIQRASC